MTVLAQIAAEALSVPYERVNIVSGDTQSTPQAPITAGSTATFSGGLAVKHAARAVEVEDCRGRRCQGLASAPESIDLVDGMVVDGTGAANEPGTGCAVNSDRSSRHCRWSPRSHRGAGSSSSTPSARTSRR